MDEKCETDVKNLPPTPVPLGFSSYDIQAELSSAFKHLYLSIVRLDLNRDVACILYSKDRPENVGKEFSWKEYFTWYSNFMVDGDRPMACKNFSSKQLLAHWKSGERFFEMDAAFYGAKGKGETAWMNLQAVLSEEGEEPPSAYVLIRHSGEEHLFKSIINQYVYSRCDYFIYLDAKNNKYTMFSGSGFGTPLLPMESSDYSSEIAAYAWNCVYPEDQEMVIGEMQLSRILEVLSCREVHSFSYGVKDSVRGYTRKQLDYRFYDRESQMILLSQTDITDIYREEQEHRRTLKEALNRAQIDSLTGLFNYQGTVDRITDSLSYGKGQFAFMFIDLDNFKSVNDTMRHFTGDELLRRIAQAIKENIRDMDLAGRIGGDEFVVFLRRIHSAQEVEGIAQRILEGVAGISDELLHGLSVSCSIGIALAPRDGMDYESLAKRADELMYQSKLAGKNRYTI